MFREKRRYGQEPDIVVRSKPHTFNLPLRLKAPARVFTCSWSDFFVGEADPWRDEAWAIIDRTRHLTYQILTKRIERVAARLPWGSGAPWPHVQIIVSVENQAQAHRRIPRLLALNAAVRGVSYEPALGSVDFRPWLPGFAWPEGSTRALNWLIIGGESGPHARPCDLAWIRSVVAQCKAAGTPCFVKQLGAHVMESRGERGSDGPEGVTVISGMRYRDRKGADPSEWPDDLRVQEFPK